MMRTDLPTRFCAFTAWPDSTSSTLITANASNPGLRIVHPQLVKLYNKIGLNCRRPQDAWVLLSSTSSCFGVLDRLPDPIRRRRHPNIAYAIAAQGIDDGADDDGRRSCGSTLASGFDPERIGR